MLRVLIVDDHAVVRRGIAHILQAEPDVPALTEARNAEEALTHLREQACDFVILDLSLPGRSGLELLKEIHHAKPHLPILVLSMQPEDQVAVRVLKAGASGYMTKDSAPEELIKALHKIMEGGRYVSPTLAERLVFNLQGEPDKHADSMLSDREFEVMHLISLGKTITQIADELSLSVKTISTYRARLLDKLNLTTNTEIMHYAMRNQKVE